MPTKYRRARLASGSGWPRARGSEIIYDSDAPLNRRYTQINDLRLRLHELQGEGSKLFREHVYTLDMPAEETLDYLIKLGLQFGAVRARPLDRGEMLLEILSIFGTMVGFIQVDVNLEVELEASMKESSTILIYGEWEVVESISQQIHEDLSLHHIPSIQWWYHSTHGTDYMTLALETSQTTHPEYYPWIKPDVFSYMTDYLESTSSILLLLGPPGTGKTSFIREFLNRHRLNAMLTYDKELLNNDYFFINFIKESNQNVLIVEDADSLLLPREDGNQGMARFLAMSDGIIKVPQKKVIMSTNLEGVQDIDPALVRPGRCHGILRFRPLIREEVTAAAAVSGIADPGRSCTLAQLWNQDFESNLTERVGF